MRAPATETRAQSVQHSDGATSMEDDNPRISQARARALEVFEDAKAAEQWIESPSIPLGNIAPLTLLDSDEGLRRVLVELCAIEYGLPV